MSPMNEVRRQRTAAELERMAVLHAQAREREGVDAETIQRKLQTAATLAKALREGEEYPGLVAEIIHDMTAGRNGEAS